MKLCRGLEWVFKEQHLLLLPQKAVYWCEQEAIIITDVHLGKVGHFRKAGIAIPKILEQEDLALLADLLNEYQPRQLIFLGDLFHSELNNDWEWLLLWRELFKEVEMILVRGNHDILHDSHYAAARFIMHDQYAVGPFIFMHEPAKSPGNLYPVSGHIHPGVRMVGKGRQSIVLPCFYFGTAQAILPAFGKFTGNAVLKHQAGDRVFGVLDNKVIAL